MEAFALGTLPSDHELQVQDEPALELALPQVYTQPALTAIQRGNLRNIEWLVAKLRSTRLGAPEPGGLGPDYQALVNEFQPLLAWATASWDYLLTTEGCRFLRRQGDERMYYRGDYHALTYADYSRLAHRVFRQCVLEFAETPVAQSLGGFLRSRFWPSVVETYQQLDRPADPRHRRLTAYSYLRCCPYQFLNAFHQGIVDESLRSLPSAPRRAVDRYFLQFFTVSATADDLRLPLETAEQHLRQGLTALLVNHRLVYCLLRQIERY